MQSYAKLIMNYKNHYNFHSAEMLCITRKIPALYGWIPVLYDELQSRNMNMRYKSTVLKGGIAVNNLLTHLFSCFKDRL